MAEINPRLLLASSFIRPGSVVADIGTDHGYLPIYAVEKGLCKGAVACDINKGPLESAKKNISRKGLTEKIQTRLCDGLTHVSKNDATDVVICGMGGLLIVKILSNCPWIKDKTKRFILQPQRDAAELRKYMFNNGFELITERAVWDNNRIYTVMVYEYSGKEETPDDVTLLIGGLMNNPTDAERDYVKKIIRSLQSRVDGLKKSDVYFHQKEINHLEKLIDQIKNIE